MEILNELKDKFIDLEYRLSPENLHCDGEISNAEANHKYFQIGREWRALEKQAGRQVEQEGREVHKWAIEQHDRLYGKSTDKRVF